MKASGGTNLLPYLCSRDREPSKNKIRRFLQMCMMVKRVRDLSPHHLQLVMVHELMQTFVERASDRAHQHHVHLQQAGRDEETIEFQALGIAWDAM